MDCVFCRIRDGQIPSTRVYEDERTIAFMDINPLNDGHTLVIPRVHAATLFEADEADLQAAIATARRVARAIRETIRPDGLNLLQANGAAAFQSVPHFHFHLVPIHRGREGLRLADGRRRPDAHPGGRRQDPEGAPVSGRGSSGEAAP